MKWILISIPLQLLVTVSWPTLHLQPPMKNSLWFGLRQHMCEEHAMNHVCYRCCKRFPTICHELFVTLTYLSPRSFPSNANKVLVWDSFPTVFALANARCLSRPQLHGIQASVSRAWGRATLPFTKLVAQLFILSLLELPWTWTRTCSMLHPFPDLTRRGGGKFPSSPLDRWPPSRLTQSS